MSDIFTIGHSNRPLEEFVALLVGACIGLLVDVRTVPRSRANPQFNTDTLPEALARHQIGYRHSAGLGGLRHTPAGTPSNNGFWENASFRAFADYAETPAFAAALDELRGLAAERRVAIMCSEAVWWRCHRRIISDYLIAAGERVFHIMAAGRIEPAEMNPAARRMPDGTLSYPAQGQGGGR